MREPDAGEKVPVPDVDQAMLELYCAVAPITGKVAPEQIVASGPAYITGSWVICKIIWLVAVEERQAACPMAVMVRVTNPMEISLSEGV